MSGCLINTEHISTYFGKGQGTCPITTQSPKLHQQARYRLPDTVNQTVQTSAQKLQTICDLRNVENYANIRHRRRHYPENTSTILHQQHRNNKHLQRSQNAYPYKSPSWTRWWWALESLNTNHNFTHHLFTFSGIGQAINSQRKQYFMILFNPPVHMI